MLVLYAGQSLRNSSIPSIFLAGPTPRGPEPKSWRLDAITLLSSKRAATNKYVETFFHYGTLLVPEPMDGPTGQWPSPRDQMQWEHEALDQANAILFWIPRSMQNMPGLTTNVEFGLYAKSGKVVLGYPSGAEHMGYIEFCANKFNITNTGLLEGALAEAARLACRNAAQLLYPTT